MDKTKDSFVLYTKYREHIEQLDMEERGKLFTAIFDYQMGVPLEEYFYSMSPVTAMCFSFIRQQLDSDNKLYEDKVKRNRENACKRWDATVCEPMRTDANAQSRIESHYDNEYDNDLKKSCSNEQPKERFKPPTVSEVKEYAEKNKYSAVDAERFCDFYESKGWMVGKNKMKDWKAAVRNWNHSQQEKTAKPMRQEVTAKRTGFVNYEQRETDYDKLILEGNFR